MSLLVALCLCHEIFREKERQFSPAFIVSLIDLSTETFLLIQRLFFILAVARVLWFRAKVNQPQRFTVHRSCGILKIVSPTTKPSVSGGISSNRVLVILRFQLFGKIILPETLRINSSRLIPSREFSIFCAQLHSHFRYFFRNYPIKVKVPVCGTLIVFLCRKVAHKLFKSW